MHDPRLGIDVGSTTVKLAVVDGATGRLAHAAYRRHFAEQAATVERLLAEIPAELLAGDVAVRVAACGSGARPLADRLGIPFVQEVVANAIAVRSLHPEARTAIELGGQDAKIVFFHRDEATGQLIASDMRMNGVCAGGTGAFLDEIAALLQVPVEAFDGRAARGSFVHHVSGRCGVFAKTDIQPLLNQGVSTDDLALSALHAVACQTIGGLAQGTPIRPPVVFEGGPLTFMPTLVRVFGELLGLEGGDVIVPAHPETIVAYGCALATSEDGPAAGGARTVTELLAALRAPRRRAADDGLPARPLFADPAERAAFAARHPPPAPLPALDAGPGPLDVYVGIDAGSTTSKLVAIDAEGSVRYGHYAPNRGRPLDVLQAALLQMRDEASARGVELRVRGVGTTGYGERLAAAAFSADHHLVETVAHARAALREVPAADFVLDIGGQDMKAIFLDGGVITSITVNEACSSGCGAFLETFATGLEVPVERIAERAFASEAPARLGSRCTVFMRSSVITEQRNGKSPDDILAGLCCSVIENVFTKVLRLPNLDRLGKRVVVQGGTFRNDAVLRAFERWLGREVTRAAHPELMGAIGAALATREQHRSVAWQQSRFLGFEALQRFGYRERSAVRCPFCGNHCERTVVDFSNGATFVQGNRCERGEILGDPRDVQVRDRVRAVTAARKAVPDVVAERTRLLLTRFVEPPEDVPARGVVGIPFALDAWRRLPFWRALFEHIGWEVRTSGPSERAQYQRGLATIPSDTVCFPAKLAHGHVLALADAGVERIVAPIVITDPCERPGLDLDRPCALLHGYPAVLRTNCQHAASVPIDTPTFVWNTPGMREHQLGAWLTRGYGVPREAIAPAIAAGLEAQRRFRAALQQRGAEVLSELDGGERFAVALAARAYQYDPLVNHDVASVLVGHGVPVLPVEALPGVDEVPLDLRVPLTNLAQARLYAAATLAAQDPRLELVQVTSFGCGHDAIVSDELARLLERGGKQLLQLKLDESDVRGPMRLRITSFLETVRSRRRDQRSATAPPEATAPRYLARDRRARTVYIPNLSPGFSELIAGLLRAQGIQLEVVPLADAAAIELGKRHVHNDICFPAQVNIGEFLRFVRDERLDPSTVAFGIHQNCNSCRAGQYAALARKALDQAGYGGVPIVTSSLEADAQAAHPGFRPALSGQIRMLWGLAVLDALEDMRRSTRPYERVPGATERAFRDALDALVRAAPHAVGPPLGVLRDAVAAFNAVEVVEGPRRPVVQLLGEIMIAVHATANYGVEAYLERNGMEVLGTRLSDFFHVSFLRSVAERRDYGATPGFVERSTRELGHEVFAHAHRVVEGTLRGYARYRPRPPTAEIHRAAEDLIAIVHECGEGWLLPGEILHSAHEGLHSFVIVQPFGCLPNHVDGRGMIRAIKERYPHVQILPLDVDPDTSVGNLENRLQMLVMNARALEARRAALEA
jgi:predicted CoA-substrate-specific enzyme activase